jgi:hypothetical protein
MPISQLLFFFIVLPIIYTMLAIILLASIASAVKQVKCAEYSYRITYDRKKAEIGQETAEKYRASYALTE